MVVDAWRECIPADPKELMAFLLDQSVETLQELLVVCTALTAHALHGSVHAKHAQVLAQAAALDMADWW